MASEAAAEAMEGLTDMEERVLVKDNGSSGYDGGGSYVTGGKNFSGEYGGGSDGNERPQSG